MANLKTLLASLLGLFWSKQENDSLASLGYFKTNYTLLTWSNSQKRITAPYSGWLNVNIRAQSVNEYLNVQADGLILDEVRSVASNQMLAFCIPVTKGRIYLVDYFGQGTDMTVRLLRNNAS